MEINVYKFLSGSLLVAQQDTLVQILTAGRKQALAVIGNNGTLHYADQQPLGFSAVLSNENKAFRHVVGQLQAWNAQISADPTLQKAGIPSIFPKELYLKSSSEHLPAKGMLEWEQEYGVKMAPSSRERPVEVSNAMLSVRVASDGSIRDLYLDWKPIVETKQIKRLPIVLSRGFLRKIRGRSNGPQIRYLYRNTQQYLVPYYYFAEKNAYYAVPATPYFSSMNVF